MEVLLSGGYSERQEVTYVAYCYKPDTINGAFENNFLDHSLGVIFHSIAKISQISLEVNTLRRLSLGVRAGNSNMAKSVYAIEMYQHENSHTTC